MELECKGFIFPLMPMVINMLGRHYDKYVAPKNRRSGKVRVDLI